MYLLKSNHAWKWLPFYFRKENKREQERPREKENQDRKTEKESKSGKKCCLWKFVRDQFTAFNMIWFVSSGNGSIFYATNYGYLSTMRFTFHFQAIFFISLSPSLSVFLCLSFSVCLPLSVFLLLSIFYRNSYRVAPSNVHCRINRIETLSLFHSQKEIDSFSWKKNPSLSIP